MIEELKKSRSTNKSMVAITRKASPDTSKKNLDDYEVEKTIGKGSYAIVKLAKCKVSGDSFAIKTYERSSLNDPLKKQSVEREISLLRKLNNEFIIKYINHVVTQSQIHLVMEFAGTRSLYEYVKKGPNRHLSVDDSLSPFIQLAKAIAYIHSKDICHRDLKLENVIYN
jgi:serine/threonine protein kinase